MSSPPSNRRKSKAAWSKEDDIRLCRSFVLATQDGEGTEHVKNMWIRVHTHYAALAASEDPKAVPRAGGALQTHWSSFIRPEAVFFMSLLVKVEKEEHEGWKENDFIEEAKNRFEVIRQKEEADTMRAYDKTKQLAMHEDVDLPPKPRTKATKFRYAHCILVLKTSKRFMRAVMSEKKPRVMVRSTQKRQRHSKLPNDTEQAVDVSEAFDDNANQRDRSSPQQESSSKRRKDSDASSSASASKSGSFSPSSPSDESNVVQAPMSNSVTAATVTPSPVVAPPATRERNIPRIDTHNDRQSSVKTPVLRPQYAQQKANYRLKLLNELRGIVKTISQLANQLANGMAVPMGMTPNSRLDPTLAKEVQQDLRFFREQKCRLKQELNALDAEGRSEYS